MADLSRTRRQLLLGTARWVGGLASVAAVTAARPAQAFQTYVANPASGVGLLYADRCGPANEHAQLISELQNRLNSDPALPSLTVTCPLCGCPVTVTR
ncbi:MAG TPA: hypothetical protein VMU85_16750 [Stellaceae bacterium]|nr:hypothetical protein [Stellaceae bacterium]